MKRIALLIMTLSLVLSGCSLYEATNYKLMQSPDEIVSIDILDNNDFNPLLENDPDPSVLCVIDKDEFSSFTSALTDLAGNNVFNDPPEGYGSVVIRIRYSNGDFELIGWHNSSRHFTDGKSVAVPFLFQKEGFRKLLQNYVDEAELEN